MLDNWHLVAAVAFLSSSMAGCTGLIEQDGPSDPQSTGPSPSGNQGSTGNGNGNGNTDPQTGAVREKPNQFALPANFPVLLPFEVRMARLSSVVGLDYSHPVFDLMRKNATQLGDYDFANGLEPDNTLTALKISLWMQALKPICASPEMLVRYPSLPESLGPMLEAAYGRSITDKDTADMTAAVEGLVLTPESRTQTTCLAVLTSLEFLAQ